MKHLVILAALLFSATAFADTEDDVRTLGRGTGILMACGDDILAEKVFAAGMKKGTVVTKWTTQKTNDVLIDEASETSNRNYTKSECKNFKHALREVMYL